MKVGNLQKLLVYPLFFITLYILFLNNKPKRKTSTLMNSLVLDLNMIKYLYNVESFQFNKIKYSVCFVNQLVIRCL